VTSGTFGYCPKVVAAVLVADDDASTRALVSSALERVGLAVREFDGGASALADARSERPSLVILRVELGDISGYEVCRELRDAYGDSLPMVFISGARTEPMDRVAGLLIGADDYLVEPLDPDELVVRARRLLRAAPARHTAPPKTSALERLTAREREVLSLLAEGLRQPEIAQQLVISPKTVATHIQRVLEKLGVHSRSQAVAVAHRAGLPNVLRPKPRA
jgi:DNA-binding NarL/FixJ family response regulator